MAMLWPYKDPDEILDYSLNWTAVLGGDFIETSSWIMEENTSPTAVVVGAETITDFSRTTVWLSGGTDGGEILMTNRIVTRGGRTFDQSVRLPISKR